MQNQRQSIISTTSQKLTRGVRHLFEVPTTEQLGLKKLLNSQPLAQRRLFLNRAVHEKLRVNLQLLPMTKAGYPVSVKGQITQISHDHFRLRSGNVTYLFRFNQVNYISRLAV